MSNVFGGKNENSLYVPISETEQEVLERLNTEHELEVLIVDWGRIEKPRMLFGDLRIQIPINVTFDRPEIHIPVFSITLELWVKNGPLLFRKEYPTMYGGDPLMLGSGVNLNLSWDIALEGIDPNLVRLIKPSATGHTNRLGNMKFESLEKKELYHMLRKQEKKVRGMP